MAHALKLAHVPELAKLQFVRWVARRYPGLYNAAVRKAMAATGRGGLGSIFPTGFLDHLIPSITALGKTYLGYREQQNVMNLQLQRLAAGQPPLPASQLGTMAPSVNVNASLAPATAATLGTSVGSAIGHKVLIVGGVLAGGGLLLWLMSHRKAAAR
ncbi:MAG: hypothetical protein ACYCUI_11575 [Vulcanimicrobiaceae bacterium]